MSKKEYLKELISQMISNTGSGHYASSMSALDIMYSLFYKQDIKPDEFILSKGHAAPALYAILYDLGYIKDLSKFRQYSGLPGHPSIETDGVLCSSGSLGMGISKAVGLATMNPTKVYHVLVGDGELQEGQNWEAMLYLRANKINNVIIHIDANEHQYSGEIRDYLEKYKFEFGGNVIIHHTRWQHDNKYLTLPNFGMVAYNDLTKQYSEYLFDLMRKNEKAIVLDADLVDDFQLRRIKKKFPGRFVECGISEQHMVSMANGIARAGYYPVCHTFGSFYRRAIDQIYNNYCDILPVVYVAGLCGKHPVNIGWSHYSIPGKYLLAGMSDILITNDIQRLEDIGKLTIYLELEIK